VHGEERARALEEGVLVETGAQVDRQKTRMPIVEMDDIGLEGQGLGGGQGGELGSGGDVGWLSFILSAGARGWWTRNTYSQLGVYYAPPVSSSMSIRPIGFADDSQTVGCHVGWDIGLMAHNHGAVFAVGCWVDLVGVSRMLRKDARIAASGRVTRESLNGLVDVTFDEEIVAEPVAQTGGDAPQHIDVLLEE
jgi:hypothetical protein